MEREELTKEQIKRLNSVLNPDDIAGGYVESGTYEIKQNKNGTVFIKYDLYVFGDYENESRHKHLKTNWLEYLTYIYDEEGYEEEEIRYFVSKEDKYCYELAECVLGFF